MCGFEDTFEPDELGINYYQAIGEWKGPMKSYCPEKSN